MQLFNQQQAMALIDTLNQQNWEKVAESLHQQGFALLENILPENLCDVIREHYEHAPLYRKTVDMQRYRFGCGEYKYFNYPLPNVIQLLRTEIYPHLVPIANTWFQQLNIEQQFPANHAAFLQQCKAAGQTEATALILKYAATGFNTLHQDLYGEVYFPMQAVIFLNQLNRDFTGGEFVLTEQIPRAQSKARVLQANQGDILIFTTQFRPKQSKTGYYRVQMKHGVSEVHTGERYTLGIIFHDAER